MTNNSIVYFMVGNKVVYLSIYIYIYSGIYRYIKLFFSFPKKKKQIANQNLHQNNKIPLVFQVHGYR